jgi:hypothetical protein
MIPIRANIVGPSGEELTNLGARSKYERRLAALPIATQV